MCILCVQVMVESSDADERYPLNIREIVNLNKILMNIIFASSVK